MTLKTGWLSNGILIINIIRSVVKKRPLLQFIINDIPFKSVWSDHLTNLLIRLWIVFQNNGNIIHHRSTANFQLSIFR